METEQLRSELLQWKQKAQKQIGALQEQVKGCDALLSALPTTRQPELPKLAAFQQAANGNESNNIANLIREALDVVSNEFTVRDILSVVNSFYPKDNPPAKDTVTSAFWKLAKERGLKIKVKGKGRRPTIYTK